MSTTADVAFLDILDPEFQVDSPEVRVAAEANWYARTATGIAVLRYAECSALMKDRRLLRGLSGILAQWGLTDGPFAEWISAALLNSEGQEHLRLRRLVSAAFNPRSTEHLRPFMRQTAHDLINSFVGAGECEFMTAFAEPYPARVIAELLGIPAEDFDDFLGWATDIGLGFGPTAVRDRDRIEAALAGLNQCCDRLLDHRRRQPADDLVSALLAAEAEGDRLSGEELRTMLTGLVFAGQDTTSNQLGLLMTTFAQRPEQWALLATQPESIAGAVEEVMRSSPSVPVSGRIAGQDFTFQDVDISAGTHVLLMVTQANADPAVFGDRSFDITATRPAHLTFGGGVHYCLGAGLARAEMCEALPILAARLGDFRIAGAVPSRPQVGITGPVSLPLQFSPESTTTAAAPA